MLKCFDPIIPFSDIYHREMMNKYTKMIIVLEFMFMKKELTKIFNTMGIVK